MLENLIRRNLSSGQKQLKKPSKDLKKPYAQRQYLGYLDKENLLPCIQMPLGEVLDVSYAK